MKEFICAVCNLEFSNASSLSNHVRSKHTDYSGEAYFALANGVTKQPLCYCGNPTKFINKFKGYNHFCSRSCSAKAPSVIAKMKTTNLDKYGSEYVFQSNQFKETYRETLLKNYGVTTPLASKVISDKKRHTCIAKYSHHSSSANPKVIAKMKATNLKKYGHVCALHAGGVQDKIKENNLVKFGFEYALRNPEIMQKQFDTKKKNNSFHTSKPEESAYEILVNVYGEEDIERQHKTEEYPFACDFYIRSTNTYIELQATWTHGKEAFDNLDEDHLALADKWKTKNSKYYRNAMNTWTIRDVLKRTTANNNNLNYLEFFNIKDFNNYFTKLD